mgnify:CR=1 FL=1
MTITTKSGKVVIVRVRNVGVNFGCEGQLVSRNGRVLASGQTRPRGATTLAEADASRLAETL